MRLQHCSFVVAACCLLVVAKLGSAQTPSKWRADSDRPSVRVSRHELRIVFPRDTARRWGWSAPMQPGFARRYTWGMEIDAIEGPRYVDLDVSSVALPRAFRSFRELVRMGRGHLCSAGMATICGEIRMTGAVESGRPVLTLRDSALISWLFALRPMVVRLSHLRPEASRLIVWDSVRIEYVAPSIRPLDSATRAAAMRTRRRESRERFNVSRAIVGGRGAPYGPMWLTVGDSVPLWLSELQSSYDMHWAGQRDLTDSGWVVIDPRIAQLLKVSSPTEDINERLSYGPPRMYLEALRPGSTTIRVRGVHGLVDAAFESMLPPGVLERQIIVTPPPHRLEITPRSDTLRMGEILKARVRVYDATDEPIDGVPVDLVCTGCRSNYYEGVEFSIWPTAPGRATMAVRLDGLADTLSIVVVDSVRR